MRILRDSYDVGITSTRVSRGVQDIFMWGLPTLSECHVASISVGLRPKNSESIHIEGQSVYHGEGSIRHVAYPSIIPFATLSSKVNKFSTVKCIKTDPSSLTFIHFKQHAIFQVRGYLCRPVVLRTYFLHTDAVYQW